MPDLRSPRCQMRRPRDGYTTSTLPWPASKHPRSPIGGTAIVGPNHLDRSRVSIRKFITWQPCLGTTASQCVAEADEHRRARNALMTTRTIATCRHCGVQISQMASGAWVPTDPANIMGVCRKGQVGEPLMLHEPMPAGLADRRLSVSGWCATAASAAAPNRAKAAGPYLANARNPRSATDGAPRPGHGATRSLRLANEECSPAHPSLG